ncbi:hypothetical protein PVK06_049037 [Gossypium arboreum]|uniref:RNase H type-1 domain-containing protein n=1 Tax=Gossypium arboreum TaxID=29729 RepID=A0ABR0MI17_GOSAR|nr:hypothetical protein PVK06_049037 [Gossypium arboreum]
MDGAVSSSVHSAAIGGVIRDVDELRAIHKMLHRNWKVHIRHVARAPNKVADFMAKYTATGFISIQVFFIPPQAVLSLIQKDILGV